MRFAACLLVGAGCNAVFGLDKTAALPPVDAQYFDAPIDAPFACPPPGMQPQFTHVVRQIEQDCAFYSSSMRMGRATAMCRIPLTGALVLHEGPLEGPFEPLADFAADGNGNVFDKGRIAPEGDLLLVRQYNNQTFTGYVVKVFRRDGERWAFQHDVAPLFVGDSDQMSEPSAGPRRQFLVARFNGAVDLYDLSETGAASLVLTMAPGTMHPVQPYRDIHFHADGLRLIFSTTSGGRTRTYVSDREALDAPFRPGAELTDVPAVYDVHMTENCDRLVFPGLGWLMWLKRA